MRYVLVVLVLIAACVNAEELMDRIVAEVGDDPIFLSDIDASLAEDIYIRRMRGEPVPTDSAQVEAMRRDLLEAMIDRKIVIIKAKEEGIEITKTEVEDALDQWLDDMIAASGSESVFMAEIERQGITLQEFKANYRKDIEEQLRVSRFMRRQFSDIGVSEAEIADFFEAKYDSIPDLPEVVGISHIIIIPQISPGRQEAARQRVKTAVERIQGGDEFARVARELSDDEITRARGGEIGAVSLEDLQGEIGDVAARLEPGQVSDPIRTGYGFEILKLDERNAEVLKLRHIFIRLHPGREDTLRASDLAREIRSRAVAGESFETLAREFSNDPQTKENGGYIGEVEMSALDEVYRTTLERLDPGDISEAMRTQHGFQILKLISRKASRKPGFEEVKGWIRNVIEVRKRERLLAEWLDKAREEVYIKRHEF
jgi:peptidyl-prolyl cis-trans isomerase SurA